MITQVVLSYFLLPNIVGAFSEVVHSGPIRVIDPNEPKSQRGYQPPYNYDYHTSSSNNINSYYPYNYDSRPVPGYIIYEADDYTPSRNKLHQGPQSWHLEFQQSQKQQYQPYIPPNQYNSPKKYPYNYPSNTIKVYEDPLVDLYLGKPYDLSYAERHAEGNRLYPSTTKFLNGNKISDTVFFYGSGWKRVPLTNKYDAPKYEVTYPLEESSQKVYPDKTLPEDFPNLFKSDGHYKPPSKSDNPKPVSHSTGGYYATETHNYQVDDKQTPSRAYMMSDVSSEQNGIDYKLKRSCRNYIRVNRQEYPAHGPYVEVFEPCARMAEPPLTHPEYPDYSNIPYDRTPMEHRYYQFKRIGRAEKVIRRRRNLMEVTRLLRNVTRPRRTPGYGYGFSNGGSPTMDPYNSGGGFNRGQESAGYGSGGYRGAGGYGGPGGMGSTGGRNYGSFSNRDPYSDNYESSSSGMTSYGNSDGRRYKNKKGSDDSNEDNEDEDQYRRKNDKGRNRPGSRNNNDDDDDDDGSSRRDSNRRRPNNNSNSSSSSSSSSRGSSGGRRGYENYDGDNNRNYGRNSDPYDGQQEGRTFGMYG